MSTRLLAFALIFAPLLFTALLFAGSARAAEPVRLPPKENLRIFLLIGQSNMAGRGKPLTADDTTPHARVLVFNKDQAWAPAVDPLHFDKPAVVGVGLGLTFAKTLAEADAAITIGLVPAAFGGSPIADWSRGGKHYVAAVARAKAALASGELAGILWHQGESDAAPEKAALYQAKLDQLIADLRTDLSAPAVPFLVGTLADTAKGAGVATINQALRTVPDRVKQTGCVLAEGLTMSRDKIHFDAESYRQLGRRYAAEWTRVTKQLAAK
jgi:hypothetical protein